MGYNVLMERLSLRSTILVIAVLSSRSLYLLTRHIIMRGNCMSRLCHSYVSTVPMGAAGQNLLPCYNKTLENLRFHNVAFQKLPIDPDVVNKTKRRKVSGAYWSKVMPEPLENPVLVAASQPCLAELLGICFEETERIDFADFFSGNKLFEGAEPHSHCYAGYQFGDFAGQLGDGAAMTMGQVLIEETGLLSELQFKGCGPTPYSRSADGRKVLRSSIREFLCSEAMHHLGIPTTRAAAIVTSDTRIIRDPLYNGTIVAERASVVTRVAPSFMRFGSFEVTNSAGPSPGDTALLTQLVDYAAESYFPRAAKHPPGSVDRVKELFSAVVASTAELVADWQFIGFVHGVLNTDNMSILGLTIDYGPYGFMEHYDPNYVSNGSDRSGRYRYSTQPPNCRWNLEKFGEALEPLMEKSVSRPILEEFDNLYMLARRERLLKKLGLKTYIPGQDEALFDSLFEVMSRTAVDFTGCFRLLAKFDPNDFDNNGPLIAAELANASPLPDVLAIYMQRTANHTKSELPAEAVYKFSMMAHEKPETLSAIFGKNIDDVRGILEEELKILELRESIDLRIAELECMSAYGKLELDTKIWQDWLEKYRDRLQKEDSQTQAERATRMNAINPAYVLTNWRAQEAIDKAVEGDYTAAQNILEKLETPFDEEGRTEMNFRHPKWAASLICTCSS